MITARLETITPSIAEEYLKKNKRNYRSINPRLVQKYASDMKEDEWELNGESIKFYENGDLFDGQHRLMAIVQCGIPMRAMVERGIPNSTTIADWGGARTIQQWGKANKFVITNVMQGIARIMVVGLKNRLGGAKGTITKYIAEHYDDLKTAERFCTTGKRHAYGKRAPIGLAVYVARRLDLVNDSIIEQFFRVFNTGSISEKEMRDPSAPLIASREILTKYRIGSGAEAQIGQYSIIIQALLDYKKNLNRKREYKYKEEMDLLVDQARAKDGII